MGIVEDVGDQVKNFKKGDRVVAAFDLGCGACMCVNCLKFNCWEGQPHPLHAGYCHPSFRACQSDMSVLVQAVSSCG